MKRAPLIVMGLFTVTLVLATACGSPEPTNTSVPPSTPSESETKSKRGRPFISTVGDTLKFDRAELRETNQMTIRLTFVNASKINQHNWVLVKDGTKDAVVSAGASAGAENSWILPGDDRILAHTGLLEPGETEEITFKAPFVGNYQFVCTFPGHAATMFGVFVSTGIADRRGR